MIPQYKKIYNEEIDPVAFEISGKETSLGRGGAVTPEEKEIHKAASALTKKIVQLSQNIRRVAGKVEDFQAVTNINQLPEPLKQAIEAFKTAVANLGTLIQEAGARNLKVSEAHKKFNSLININSIENLEYLKASQLSRKAGNTTNQLALFEKEANTRAKEINGLVRKLRNLILSKDENYYRCNPLRGGWAQLELPSNAAQIRDEIVRKIIMFLQFRQDNRAFNESKSYHLPELYGWNISATGGAWRIRTDDGAFWQGLEQAWKFALTPNAGNEVNPWRSHATNALPKIMTGYNVFGHPGIGKILYTALIHTAGSAYTDDQSPEAKMVWQALQKNPKVYYVPRGRQIYVFSAYLNDAQLLRKLSVLSPNGHPFIDAVLETYLKRGIHPSKWLDRNLYDRFRTQIEQGLADPNVQQQHENKLFAGEYDTQYQDAEKILKKYNRDAEAHKLKQLRMSTQEAKYNKILNSDEVQALTWKPEDIIKKFKDVDIWVTKAVDQISSLPAGFGGNKELSRSLLRTLYVYSQVWKQDTILSDAIVDYNALIEFAKKAQFPKVSNVPLQLVVVKDTITVKPYKATLFLKMKPKEMEAIKKVLLKLKYKEDLITFTRILAS